MRSYPTEAFIDGFRNLPSSVQDSARKSYRLWLDNPRHPSLRFKRIHDIEPIYSVRVGRKWRALGLVENESVTWFWIGSHNDYDKILAQR